MSFQSSLPCRAGASPMLRHFVLLVTFAFVDFGARDSIPSVVDWCLVAPVQFLEKILLLNAFKNFPFFHVYGADASLSFSRQMLSPIKSPAFFFRNRMHNITATLQCTISRGHTIVVFYQGHIQLMFTKKRKYYYPKFICRLHLKTEILQRNLGTCETDEIM